MSCRTESFRFTVILNACYSSPLILYHNLIILPNLYVQFGVFFCIQPPLRRIIRQDIIDGIVKIEQSGFNSTDLICLIHNTSH